MKAEIAKMEKLRDELERHPLTVKLRQDQSAEILAGRQEAATRIEALGQEAEAVLSRLQAEEDRAREELAAHDNQRKVLQSNLAAATVALMKERQRLDREKATAEEILLETYDPRLDQAINFFRDKFDTFRSKRPNSDTRVEGINAFTLTKRMTTFSNIDAIASALRFCNTAIAELEKMKLSPVLDAVRIESLKKGIPDVNEMRETGGDKPMPPIITNPRLLMKSDDQHEWEIGKLNEKFKKLMKK
jgi:chromosome segregation ATPase